MHGKHCLGAVGLFLLLALSTTTAFAQPTTIQLVTYGSLPNEWLAMADAFNRSQDEVIVEVQVYPFEEYIDKVLLMIASGNPPDVFQVWAQYKPQWVEMGLLEDVTDRWQSSSVMAQEAIYPFMIEAAALHGRMYGVPYDYNSTVYFVNRDLLAQAGLNPPAENWTVDDLREMSRRVTNEQWATYGTTHGVDFGWGFNIQWFKNWAGHGWINEAGDTVLVDSPASIELMEWWYESQYAYGITPRPGGFAARGGWEAGGYGFMQGWMDTAFHFPQPMGFDWELALYPKGPAGQGNFAQGHMFSIAASSTNKEAAWKVLEWMASYEGQEAIIRTTRRQPIGPYLDLWALYFDQLPGGKGPEISQWVLGVLYGKGYADNLDYWPTFPEMNDIMGEHMARIYGQNRPVGPEMEEAARRMQQVLDEYLATR